MPAEDRMPSEADFTKTLTVVLLAEYAVVMIAQLLRLWCAGASPLVADMTAFIAVCVFGATVAANLATMATTIAIKKDPAYAGFARISFTLTGGHLILLVASVMCGRLAFDAVALAVTVAAIIWTVALSPGKFLRPPASP